MLTPGILPFPDYAFSFHIPADRFLSRRHHHHPNAKHSFSTVPAFPLQAYRPNNPSAKSGIYFD